MTSVNAAKRHVRTIGGARTCRAFRDFKQMHPDSGMRIRTLNELIAKEPRR